MLHVDVGVEVRDLDDVPTDRRVALRLLWMGDDPHVRLDALTHVISADPGLSARLLVLANASLACPAGGVASLARAVSVLGPQAVQAVACTAVLNLFSNRPELPESFWLHAITAGVAAAQVAFHLHLDPGEALTAGLLHDLGEQLLRAQEPGGFDEIVVSMANEPWGTRRAIERQRFGTDHATLGAQVLAGRGLPARLTNAVLQHHDNLGTEGPLTQVVRVADCIAKIIEGDTHLDLDATLHASGIAADGDRLMEQTETDRRALVQFLAADFPGPRSTRR